MDKINYPQLTKLNLFYNLVNKLVNLTSWLPNLFWDQGVKKNFMSKNLQRAASILSAVALISWLLIPSSSYIFAEGQCRAGQYNFTKTLYKGMKDPQVKDLQEMLAYCESSDIYPEKVVSGYYGSLTEAAVKRFQKKYGISPVGTFGPLTRAKANELYGQGAQAQQPQTGATSQNQLLQQLLQQLASQNPALAALLQAFLQTQVGQQPQAPAAPTGQVSVSLSPDSPTTGTLVETQSGAVLLKFVVSNGTNSDVTITGMNLRRIGVSSDYSLTNVYLYANNERVSDPASVSQNYARFTGLNVKIPAGGSVTFSVVADISSGTSGQTVGFSLESASDVLGAQVSGSFPIRGFTFQIASRPTDLANITFQGTTQPTTSNVNAGSMGFTIYRDQVQVNNREVVFRGLRLRMIGSIAQSDLANAVLYIDGQKIASGVWTPDNYLVFKPDNPVTLKTGNRNFEVRADIVGGSTRQFSMSLRYPSDFDIIDAQYNVGVPVTGTPRNTGTLTIQGASLVVTRLPFQSSYAVKDSRVVVGKFELQAYGEPVKVENLTLKADGTDLVAGLRNGAIYLDGSQVGPTLNISTSSSGTQFNNLNFVVYPGKKYILEVWADLTDFSNVSKPGINSQISLTLKQGSNNAQGTQSLNLINAPASDISSDQLTVVTGQALVLKNASYGDQSFVRGKQGAKIASFVVSASQHEKLTITSFQLQFSTSPQSYYTNLKISASNDVKVVPASSETFSLSEDVNAGQQKIIDVYADLLTSAPTGEPNAIFATATVSYITPSGFSGSSSVKGQKVTVTDGGTLNAVVYSDTPKSKYVVTGSSGVEFLKVKVNATREENIRIEEIELMASTTAPGYNTNISVWDGNTNYPPKASWDVQGSATSSLRFTGLNIVVPANTEKVLTFKSDIGLYTSVNVNTGVTTTFIVKEIKYRGVDSGVLQTNTSTLVGNPMTIYRGNLLVRLEKNTTNVKPVYTDQFLKLKVNGVTNESGSSLKIATATIQISSNHFATSSNIVVNVYDGATLIATSAPIDWSTVSGNTATTTIYFGGRDLSGEKVYTMSLSGVNALTAQGGYTVTFKINDFTWEDGGGSSNISLDPESSPEDVRTVSFSFSQ